MSSHCEIMAQDNYFKTRACTLPKVLVPGFIAAICVCKSYETVYEATRVHDFNNTFESFLPYIIESKEQLDGVRWIVMTKLIKSRLPTSTDIDLEKLKTICL